MPATTVSRPSNSSKTGEPVWELARFYPAQGSWSEADYLDLADETNHLVEFSDGCLEVLPMPTDGHQAMCEHLFMALREFAGEKLGKVRFAALPVHLWPGKFREPDILFLLAANDWKRANECWAGADLVMEVVSEKGRRRDLVTKRDEYARAGIAEYWMVDPKRQQITVLKLEGGSYVEHGVFRKGSKAASALLKGFTVDVTKVLTAK